MNGIRRTYIFYILIMFGKAVVYLPVGQLKCVTFGTGGKTQGRPLTFYCGPASVPFLLHSQCPKLRVHPGLCVHISMAGCTILGSVHPVCARLLRHLSLLYIGRVHGAISGCTVLWEVHPTSAQNKSLISDTDS